MNELTKDIIDEISDEQERISKLSDNIEIAKDKDMSSLTKLIKEEIKDIKYKFLKLGGYFKILKEKYHRETIEIYNKQNNSNIVYEEVENFSRYSKSTNRSFEQYCKQFDIPYTSIWRMIQVYDNFTEEYIESLPKSMRSFQTLSRLLSVEENHFNIEDFLNLKLVGIEFPTDCQKFNKDLDYSEIRQAISKHNQLTREYKKIQQELAKEGITLEEKLISEEEVLKKKLMDELNDLRKYKTKMENEKDKIIKKEIEDSIKYYEIQAKSFELEKEKLEKKYGNIDKKIKEQELRQIQLDELEEDIEKREKELEELYISNDDVKEERKELLDKRAKLSKEVAKISNEISALTNEKVETIKSLESIQNDINKLIPFRNKFAYLNNYKTTLIEIIDKTKKIEEILSDPECQEYISDEIIKKSYVEVLDETLDMFANLYEKLGIPNTRIIAHNLKNSIVIETDTNIQKGK